MKKFESLLKSEINKINKAAQQRDNTDVPKWQLKR